VAQDHPRILDYLPTDHVELGVHGLRHVNYGRHPAAFQAASVAAAVDLFASLGLPAPGWRSPYLVSGAGTVAAVKARGLLWDASATIAFAVPLVRRLPRAKRQIWARAMAFYQPLAYEHHAALPRLDGPTVFFPTALPDDELLIDRLNLAPERCAAIWIELLQRTHVAGELLVLQLHPERIYRFQLALQWVLRAAKRLPVWIATLEQLATWWKARSRATLTVEEVSDGYRVMLSAPHDATLQLLTPGAAAPAPLDGTRALELPRWWPGIGVHGDAAAPTVARLRAAGFAAEIRVPGREYAAEFPHERQADLVRFQRDLVQGRHLRGPVVKLNYWPGAYRSALAVTGDLCSLTWLDFVKRYGR
jgi:peptidoglycan/xylan/chitin deacetylase (PgdA/CDA1 family)